MDLQRNFTRLRLTNASMQKLSPLLSKERYDIRNETMATWVAYMCSANCSSEPILMRQRKSEGVA